MSTTENSDFAEFERVKAELMALFNDFMALDATQQPRYAVYSQLDQGELRILVEGSHDILTSKNLEYAEAALKFGWITASRDWYAGFSSRFLDLLVKEGRLLRFYLMLMKIKGQG